MRSYPRSVHGLRGLVFLALLLGVPTMLHAEVFKCVSQEGRISYGDSPCAKGVAQAANISAEVGACTTPECEAQRAQQATAAQLRLREDKEALSEMMQQRRQADAAYAAERTRLMEAQRLAAEEERADALLYQAGQTYYPGYPLYPTPLPCKRGNCFGRHPRVGMIGNTPSRPVRPVHASRLDQPAPLLTNPPAVRQR
jgi:hypothetical protein